MKLLNPGDRVRNRVVVALGVASLATAIVLTGAAMTGRFDAKVSLRNTPFGPVNMGLNGDMGIPRARDTKTHPEVVYAYPPGTAPYNGPTQEELDVLAAYRSALEKEYDKAYIASSSGGVMPKTPPPMALPLRHLTQYEIAELYRSARRLGGEDVPQPLGTD